MVIVVGKRRPVELVGSGLGDHLDGSAARQSLLGIEVVRGDVDLLNRFRGGDVGRVVRQPDVDALRAIKAGVVVVAGGPVDVGRQGALGSVGVRVLERCRRRAGNQVDESLVVPIRVHRHRLDLFAAQLRLDRRRLRLEDRRGRGDRNDFRDVTDLHRRVQPNDAVGGNGQISGRVGREPLLGDLQIEGSGQDVPDIVIPIGIGHRFASLTRTLVGNGHGRAGDNCAGLVGDSPDQRSVQHLSAGKIRRQHGGEDHRQD